MSLTTRMRRTAAVASIAVAVPLVLVACTSKSPEATSSAGTTSAATNATISYWLWDTNQQPAYQQCADD